MQRGGIAGVSGGGGERGVSFAKKMVKLRKIIGKLEFVEG